VPDVSLILPCYNAEETIEEALISLKQQTLNDFEIIAVDDGSEDATLSILQSWSEREKRLRIIKQPHMGVIAASNWGITESRSKFIARMDADDVAHPRRLELQTAYLNEHPEVAVVSCLVKVFAKNGVREGYRLYVEWLNSLITNEQIRREMFVESPLANPSVMIRKEWLGQMGGYEEHGWPEDYDLWLRMYLAGAVFEKIPKVLLLWRDHQERITRTDPRYSVTNFLRAKAHYLVRGPLLGKSAVIIWGAGMMGRRLGKHLQDERAPLRLYVDIDPKKIGKTKRGCPIVAPDELQKWWETYKNPVILAAVGARKARGLIRQRLIRYGFVEGMDWWAAA
jgi:glycosyltransferase involved in cell wall biosynthesis